jgi:hypothetical protein
VIDWGISQVSKLTGTMPSEEVDLSVSQYQMRERDMERRDDYRQLVRWVHQASEGGQQINHHYNMSTYFSTELANPCK